MAKELITIPKNGGEDEIGFYDDGTLYASAYSYYIDSFGELELTQEETKNLYLKMKEFYEGKEVD